MEGADDGVAHADHDQRLDGASIEEFTIDAPVEQRRERGFQHRRHDEQADELFRQTGSEHLAEAGCGGGLGSGGMGGKRDADDYRNRRPPCPVDDLRVIPTHCVPSSSGGSPRRAVGARTPENRPGLRIVLVRLQYGRRQTSNPLSTPL